MTAEKHVMVGNPDEAKISTSYVERQNLTMRMVMGRFTRLTRSSGSRRASLSLHDADLA